LEKRTVEHGQADRTASGQGEGGRWKPTERVVKRCKAHQARQEGRRCVKQHGSDADGRKPPDEHRARAAANAARLCEETRRDDNEKEYRERKPEPVDHEAATSKLDPESRKYGELEEHPHHGNEHAGHGHRSERPNATGDGGHGGSLYTWRPARSTAVRTESRARRRQSRTQSGAGVSHRGGGRGARWQPR
jgi:hypothetical protein